MVCPDTSPRNLGIPGESDSWDFGVGAGFYVDATVHPYQRYKMYSFISCELPEWVASNFNVDPCRSGIMGHSMGGHGALVIGLRNPEKYKSISAFSPIGTDIFCSLNKKFIL